MACTINADEIKRVKAQGFLNNKGTDLFNARIITVNGTVSHTLEGDLLTLIAPGPFEKNQIDKPAVLEICSNAASGLLGRPIRVRVSLKGKQAFSGGEKSFDTLMDFGKQHSDIIKFTK